MKPSDKEKKEILFGEFVFRDDLEPNVTVRRGVKWYGAYGDYVARPSDENNKQFAKIRIIASEIYTFYEIPARAISFEHDERCIDYAHLLAEMEECYEDFDPREYVTVLYFYVIEYGKDE